MFTCKICGNEVELGQAYCAKCGADVVDNYEAVCPSCGTKNGAGSRYCAKCGNILGVMRKPVCGICGSKNLPGARFCVFCGAPVAAEPESHAEADVLEGRKTKLKLDLMVKDRMRGIDNEVADKRRKVAEEKAKAMKEVEDYRAKTNEEFAKQARMLDSYRQKVNELGSEDVAQLKKLSAALKKYSTYYADPYSEMDEDEIEGETYVCPACGTVNASGVTMCSHCGRSRSRSTLLLAKGKIKQSPPIKRKKDVIPAPEQDLSSWKTPTFDEYAGEEFEKSQTKPIEVPASPEDKPAAAPRFVPGGIPAYPYSPYGAPMFYNRETGEAYQMPPIVQPVAFVPYVTQEQPLMQYSPTGEYKKDNN